MASTSSKGLFSASLISPTITSTLPSPYTIRPLERGDYAKGFLDCLRVLTDCGDVSEEKFLERYEFWEKVARETYFPLVIDDGKRICATGILLVERKFIHNLGTIGHIEEISVLKELQGQKLGITMIKALDSIAVSLGCYKTILNCSAHNEAFYEKCGFEKASTEMSHYFETGKSGWERG